VQSKTFTFEGLEYTVTKRNIIMDTFNIQIGEDSERNDKLMSYYKKRTKNMTITLTGTGR
jgi:hypothetical protein